MNPLGKNVLLQRNVLILNDLRIAFLNAKLRVPDFPAKKVRDSGISVHSEKAGLQLIRANLTGVRLHA